MAAEPLPLRLPARSRLKLGHEFARVKVQGRRTVSGCLIANWLELAAGASPRLGVITSKKVGNAVHRARARRLLRETFRLHQHDLAQPVSLVLVARPSIARKGLAAVERDFLAALRHARLLRTE